MGKKKDTPKAEAATKALSTTGLFTQNDVPEMLKKVTEQIKRLTGGMGEGAKTTGDLPGFGKIKDIKSVSQLIMAYSSVVGREKAYKEAAKELIPVEVKVPTFSLSGSTAKEWKTDIEARVLVVANQAQLNKLKKIKTTLEANLSAEAKLANDLAGIAKDLSDEQIGDDIMIE